MIRMVRYDPVGGIIYIVSFLAAILISLILHECAHGYIAYRCGDPTAKMLGRLSLDPRKHLDPIGTLCMLVLGIGWAKPVPVNPRNFRSYRRDDFLVSIAGIVTNLVLFLLSTALLVGMFRFQNNAVVAYINQFLYMLSSINLSLALFNLLPIPPLDGHHLVNDTLLRGRLQLGREQLMFCQLILVAICMTGLLSRILSSAHTAVYNAVLRLFLGIVY